ncbi:glutaminase domain-containing protein, partial [Sunxiuqinia sp. A32]|uniref:glutaminase domain-containing protein n=1 Tax=Sunxiuqinia sp. A32 TaxID=3461496 RepID=UPI0040460F2A
NLKAWWTKEGTVSIDDAMELAVAEHDQIMNSCADFDNQLWEETVAAGGKEYADLCVLAFRQSIAAHKLVKDPEGNILFLSKENFSNGSIGTVDVTYPSAPMYLKYNPDMLKGMLNPIFYYSESGKWTKPFAAHDVGTYPKANGQTYGGDMPVEECGNMVILTAAIAEAEGNADYAAKHWDVLTTWSNYLLENGLDPENQLCTDDFAGHFAHNVNLSVKAIMGIASYGKLAAMLGKDDVAAEYTGKAKEMAKEWMKMADDGDHYRLTFDQEGTWSQKYNLVWDKLMNLGIFPEEVAQTEIAYYLTKQNKYGLPLDNRRTYTKSDWVVWTATLAQDKETFQKFISPLHDFVTETPDRVPMTDWYETPSAKQVGFQARSVVGGYFIKLLEKK